METRSRKLEQFFYMMGVDYIDTYKDEDGMTVWVYPDDELTRHIHEEFRLAAERRRQKKGE